MTKTELLAYVTPIVSDNALLSALIEILKNGDSGMGVYGDKVNPAGAAKYSAPDGFYFYGCKCRIADSKISACEKNVNGTVSADATDSYIGITMYQGEYHPFTNKIVSVTLTAGTDQMQYLIKPL